MGPQALLLDAIAVEGDAQRALLDADRATARAAFRRAARLYRASWECAPPRSYGRLIGMLKAAVLGGDARAAAAYVRAQIPPEAGSPAASYALAIAALIESDDGAAASAARRMLGGSPAFDRAAAAVAALAAHDGAAYAAAVSAIIADFEARDAHLTGVAIADTAVMFERLARRRGLACRPRSPLVPVAVRTASARG